MRDQAAAGGERVDPVLPRRGRAGGGTAVIQDHPREHPGPVRLGDHAGHLVLEAIRKPVAPGESGAGLRPAGLPEPGRPDAFRAPPPAPPPGATSATGPPPGPAPAGPPPPAAAVSPVTSWATCPPLVPRNSVMSSSKFAHYPVLARVLAQSRCFLHLWTVGADAGLGV